MVNVVGVRFRTAGKIYYFAPCEFIFKKSEMVIVETARGVECGEVVVPNHEVPDEDVVAPLKNVIRKADDDDLKHVKENREKEKEAFSVCLDKIKKHGLDMKLRSGETAGWPECPCTILYSDIKAEMHVISSDNQSEKLTYVEYSPEIYFRYEVDGRPVISPFYERIADSYSMRTTVEKIANSFPPGTRSVCYVNPDNPTEAVLAKGGFSFLMYGLIGSGLALAALMLMLAASLSCRSRLQNWN